MLVRLRDRFRWNKNMLYDLPGSSIARKGTFMYWQVSLVMWKHSAAPFSSTSQMSSTSAGVSCEAVDGVDLHASIQPRHEGDSLAYLLLDWQKGEMRTVGMRSTASIQYVLRLLGPILGSLDYLRPLQPLEDPILVKFLPTIHRFETMAALVERRCRLQANFTVS